MIWATLTSGIWNTSQVIIPVAIGWALDHGIGRHDSGEVILWSVVILLLGVVRAVTGTAFYRQSTITATLSGCLTMQLVTQHLIALGASLSREQDVGNLTATATSDVTAIGNGLRHVGRVVGSVIAVIVITVIMFMIKIPLGLLVLVTVPAVVLLGGLLLRPLHRHQGDYRSQQSRLAGRAVDIASGLRVLRGIGGERQFAKAFHSDSAQLRVADARVARAEANLSATDVLMPGLIAVIVTYAAARFVLSEQVTVGQLVEFYAFAVFLTLPLHDIMEGANQITRALVSAGRVTALLNTPAPDRGSPASTPETRGTAHLVDTDSGLDLPPSTLMAVACAQSSDAEMLARRLARFEDSGNVKLGDDSLSSLPIAVARSRVLLARNNDRFFAGTIRHEIEPSGTAEPEKVADTLRIASATDIIDALPDGLDTQMTGRGRTFSGGQLQRLRLTRALLTDADFTLLVEPTNAVDAYTEHAIARNLAQYHESGSCQRSTVVFTVSPLILQQAQVVAYVDGGHVVATGSHEELLDGHPEYRKLMARDEASVVGQ
ncbi:ABC transporter ATP-binding protein [Streptomyces sp. NPDC048279]|uniref:ABC transporter ATP-binding protein n=1 Tax=Streptomyces sp. NPDC048279 TaxID=3154714 RepID=UPI003446B67D